MASTVLDDRGVDRARDLAGERVPDGVDAGGRHRARHRRGRAAVGRARSRRAARPARPTISRMRGSSASRRRWSSACGSGSTSRRRSRREAYGSRYALPIWSDFMRQALRYRQARRVRGAGRRFMTSRCAASRTCVPLKAARSTPSTSRRAIRFPAACVPIHQGSVKQRVRRVVEGFLSGLGKRIGRIFR